MEDLEMEAITAARVANEERLGFCPRHVGMAKIFAFEWRIVNRMGTEQWMLFHRPGATTSHEAHAARKLF